MELLPVTTRTIEPPQDDVLHAIQSSKLSLQEGDVLCISSKVLAIHEGECQKMTREEKRVAERAHAELTIQRPYWSSPLSVIHHTFLGNAGLDESNGGGYVVGLPRDPFASAKQLWQWLRKTYACQHLGVVVTDSRSLPFRYGATGVALGWWGIEPLLDHKGEADLFGRPLQYERSNVVDGIAAAANVVMGETDASTPIVIVRNIPRLQYTTVSTKEQLFCPFEEDTFRVLYEDKL